MDFTDIVVGESGSGNDIVRTHFLHESVSCLNGFGPSSNQTSTRSCVMRRIAMAWCAAIALLAFPAMTYAQGLGSIAGVAKDSSGALIPGVTVEVASSALIE